MSNRPNLVGRGYMPKGGVAAAARSNEEVRARRAAVVIESPDQPDAAVVRVSARTSWLVGPWPGLVGAVSGLTALVVSVVR